MNYKLIPVILLAGLFGCKSSSIQHSDPTAIWAHLDYDDHEKGMQDAIKEIQAGKIIIPFDGFIDEVELHRVLRKDYGIRIVDCRKWPRGYSTAYNQAMRQAAANRFGSEWWIDALQEAGIDMTKRD